MLSPDGASETDADLLQQLLSLQTSLARLDAILLQRVRDLLPSDLPAVQVLLRAHKVSGRRVCKIIDI